MSTLIITIEGKDYELGALHSIDLGHLVVAKVKSRALLGIGVSIPTLNAAFVRMGEILENYRTALEAWQAEHDAWEEIPGSKRGPEPEEPANPTMDLLDDEVILANLIGLVFLTKRMAGERYTFEDAMHLEFADISLRDRPDEDDEDAEDADPKGSPAGE